jgi:hypothetical protein
MSDPIDRDFDEAWSADQFLTTIQQEAESSREEAEHAAPVGRAGRAAARALGGIAPEDRHGVVLQVSRR